MHNLEIRYFEYKHEKEKILRSDMLLTQSVKEDIFHMLLKRRAQKPVNRYQAITYWSDYN